MQYIACSESGNDAISEQVVGCFAGIMAFILSDLVVFPVLRINAKYYGSKMAYYILAVFFGFAGGGILDAALWICRHRFTARGWNA